MACSVGEQNETGCGGCPHTRPQYFDSIREESMGVISGFSSQRINGGKITSAPFSSLLAVGWASAVWYSNRIDTYILELESMTFLSLSS
jgi:hypothetical protein